MSTSNSIEYLESSEESVNVKGWMLMEFPVNRLKQELNGTIDEAVQKCIELYDLHEPDNLISTTPYDIVNEINNDLDTRNGELFEGDNRDILCESIAIIDYALKLKREFYL